MLGLQGNASSSKEYTCVACSATFTGLTSLLVHQATHASSLPKLGPNSSDFNLLQASPAPSSEDRGSSVPKMSSTSMYICDCGEEFKDFSVMIEHKQSHVPEMQPPAFYNILFKRQSDQTASQTDEALGEGSATSLSSFNNIGEKEEPAAGNCTEEHSPVSAEVEQQLEVLEASVETAGNENHKLEPKNKFLMKILASTYGKHLVPPTSEEDDKVSVSLKEEPELVVIAPPTTKGPSTVTDMSTMRFKRLLGKLSIKTKAPPISRLLESSTKKIVSLTKIFSPVVLLETRHKFMDPGSNGTYGKYQCARCRRVFHDTDSLTEHHILHKKERIKCCRCCKQLIIGRVPLPDNHVCPQTRAKTTTPSYSFKSIATNRQKAIQMNSLNKVYFCPICKHNFARRYNLKKHKCCGPVSSFLSADKIKLSQSIGVGTRSIKVEDTSDPEFETKSTNLSWSSPSLMKEQNQSAFLDKHENKSETKRRASVNFYVKNGVRRYPCNKCHKTFGLTSNLSRHRKLCCTNPKVLGSGPISNGSLVNVSSVKMYPCYVCGRNFNRKDNMMAHRKRCELKRTMIPNFASEISPSLPPSSAPLDIPEEEEDEGNWSIMSLPSVLPRRVTCECGIGFTSPKLLLEHLQKHAKESYTCPTCGVTVSSWADYEIHLQLHMHPQHHKQPQPLLLRFKQPTTVQQPSQPVVQKLPAKPQFRQEQQLPKKKKKQQRTVCAKCGKSFASRCSLRRHISWNRCKALRMTISNKTYHCSLCNSDFPNAISLLFHQRGGSCKPAIKPVRCPICLRWFTTTDGLQKHLLAHKNSETFRCDVCQGTYPSLKSLKIHRRRIHRIMARSANPEANEPALSTSISV